MNSSGDLACTALFGSASGVRGIFVLLPFRYGVRVDGSYIHGSRTLSFVKHSDRNLRPQFFWVQILF